MKHQVMVVDDNPFVLDLMAEEIREIGLDAVCAADGVEALGRLQWDDYALLITDLELPGLTGLQVIEQAHRAYPSLRIIALAADDTGSQCKARLFGAEVLCKPFSMVDFRKAVEHALKEARAGPWQQPIQRHACRTKSIRFPGNVVPGRW